MNDIARCDGRRWGIFTVHGQQVTAALHDCPLADTCRRFRLHAMDVRSGTFDRREFVLPTPAGEECPHYIESRE